MVVDDSPSILQVIEDQLQSEGFDVATACSAELAIEWCEKNGAPNLLLTDIQMPGLDGPELYSWVRGRYKDVPVLFMTGDIQSARVSTFPLLGKPFNRDQLLAMVKNLA